MPVRDAEALKSFLTESTLAYSSDGYAEEMVGNGLVQASFRSGGYEIKDDFNVSSDNRIYNGREVVLRDGEAIWAAAYHGAVNDTEDPVEILDIYAKVLETPAEELPIRGPRQVEINGYKYQLDSLSGPLQVARFAIVESITEQSRQLYQGHIAGGWL
jgi:hypothetical protein